MAVLWRSISACRRSRSTGHALREAVAVLAALDGLDGRPADRLGGVEVGLPDREVDRVAELAPKSKTLRMPEASKRAVARQASVRTSCFSWSRVLVQVNRPAGSEQIMLQHNTFSAAICRYAEA